MIAADVADHLFNEMPEDDCSLRTNCPQSTEQSFSQLHYSIAFQT
jgi:hypothetical protein